jgi:5'-deoxynucleotidase
MGNKFLELVSSPLMNLDHTYRYSGTKLVESESLSQHIIDTVMMGLKIIDTINTKAKATIFYPDVYVMKAIYHDLEEVITGDIPRPLKYHDEITLQSMRNIADEVAKELFEKEFSDWKSHYKLWDTAKEDPEGYILKIVDNLVVVNKVVKEVSLLHNYYMLRVAHEVIQYTSELKSHTKEYIFSGDVLEYINELLEDAIQSMQDILDEHKDKLNICGHSMI